MRGRRSRHGFTLLELLVVIVLMGVATSLGMTMFSKVSDTWRRTEIHTELNDRAMSAFEQMRRDFTEVLSAKVSGFAMRGTPRTTQDNRFFRIPLEHDRIVIPVELPGRSGKPSQHANIGYHIERKGGAYTLVRTTGPLGPEDPTANRLKVADGVLAMRIEYLDDSEGGTWRTGWSRPTLPDAVRVSLTLMDPVRYFEQISRKAVFTIKVD